MNQYLYKKSIVEHHKYYYPLLDDELREVFTNQ